MVKNYLFASVFSFFAFTYVVFAQDTRQAKPQETAIIEGLSMYPNPVSTGKVYINTQAEAVKEIVIFDILGKKVLQLMLVDNELNVSNLNPGIYIVRITEKDITATRKLIVR